MSETTAKPIPVVPGHPVFGSTIDFQKGQLDWILEGHERFGDAFSARILWRDWHFVRDPGVVHAVSVTEASKFHKSSIAKRMWKQFLGNGLVMNDGDSWKRQHKLIMPDFQKRRRDDYEDRGDLLSHMVFATDGQGSMSDEQLRDEAMTLMAAGHETTSHALTWIWYFLATHPDETCKLHQEVVRVLGEETITVDKIAELPYTRMVI